MATAYTVFNHHHSILIGNGPATVRQRKATGDSYYSLERVSVKHNKNSENSRHGVEEVGSYQLRKKNSNKPQGFVDVSIHISEDVEGRSSYTGNEGGLGDHSNTT
ncbi:uncharacterized protein LOC112175446 [Rosa chinensis]|uniref:uncharacterized protein LOC112175446 n=1 Tax=Rosa chinensis TaxID=74649 RepID=UPI000D08689E|nr:uncharacterized protein LOC112175446 [Rosa chinensis]